MIKLSAQDFASVVSGSLHDISPYQILDQDPVINSKDASAKNFFVAFKGEKFDGHDFVSEALNSGAKFSLVSKSVSGPHVLVSDVGQALIDLARFVRTQLPNMKVIGITGSQGKTTTKEFLYSVLQNEGTTVATAGNFNTDIGVPLTLLRSTEATKFCILEMGARHVGDIAKLTELANPNVGVVLVVGTAHLGEFGSVEAIAKTKSELIKALSPKMTAVLGTYDQFTPKMADSLDLNTVLFGDGQIVRAADIELHGGFAHFDLVTPAGRNSVALQVIGEHQIPNALAAAAAAFSLGVKNESIAIGLTTALLSSKWRMQIETINGIQIIHDYYNANPESMKAALKTLVMLSQESGGASWAILGKMHELGSKESSGHLEVAEFASQLGVDHLVSVAPAVYQESNNQSSDENMLIHNCSSAAAVLELVNNISTGDVILLKASRSEKFEDLAELIKKALEGDQA
ncbi:MAG: UDP-N-acetylmuramoyl-tripeptide--D-alanyl-D-alanine ligase [Candidatus Nanopelagicus sp.]|jgi:UDP-N-acetylmuramoyl-tripeptide--D-alanyl-D-alanine ligase